MKFAGQAWIDDELNRESCANIVFHGKINTGDAIEIIKHLNKVFNLTTTS